MLEELRAIGAAEETNIAEIIRRVGDLIITFDIPPANAPIPPIYAGANTERFTYFIPNPQLSQLTDAAVRRGLTVHELLRQGLILYSKRKRKALREWTMPAVEGTTLTVNNHGVVTG